MFRALFWILDRVPAWLRPAVVGALAVLVDFVQGHQLFREDTVPPAA